MKAENTGLFVLDTHEFDSIRALVYDNTGISLSPAKRELVKRRFTPRLKALGLSSFSDYLEYLGNNFDCEEVYFCNAITTNLTSFFRENHHFELMAGTMLPELVANKPNSHRFRLWSAGCSTGQEAYCMAITLLRHMPDIGRRNVRILGTDLDESCLDTARAGSYPVKELETVPESILNAYFRHETLGMMKSVREVYTAKENVKSLITFNKLNLMHKWPMKGRFDIIFCRNVFIYFDKATQTEMLKGFSALQDVGDFLCLGHSEIITNPGDMGYSLIGKTTYRKVRSV